MGGSGLAQRPEPEVECKGEVGNGGRAPVYAFTNKPSKDQDVEIHGSVGRNYQHYSPYRIGVRFESQKPQVFVDNASGQAA
jgi:hypothetical protein